MQKIKFFVPLLLSFLLLFSQISCKRPTIEADPIEQKTIGEGNVSYKMNGVLFSIPCKMITRKRSTGIDEIEHVLHIKNSDHTVVFSFSIDSTQTTPMKYKWSGDFDNRMLAGYSSFVFSDEKTKYSWVAIENFPYHNLTFTQWDKNVLKGNFRALLYRTSLATGYQMNPPTQELTEGVIDIKFFQ